MNVKFGNTLLIVLTAFLALFILLLLIFFNIRQEEASHFGTFISGFASILTAVASLGAIYATMTVSNAVNAISTRDRREDEYTEHIIEQMIKFNELSASYEAFCHKNACSSVFNKQDDFEEQKRKMMRELIICCHIIIYYVKRHPLKSYGNQLMHAIYWFLNDLDGEDRREDVKQELTNFLEKLQNVHAEDS